MENNKKLTLEEIDNYLEEMEEKLLELRKTEIEEEKKYLKEILNKQAIINIYLP